MLGFRVLGGGFGVSGSGSDFGWFGRLKVWGSFSGTAKARLHGLQGLVAFQRFALRFEICSGERFGL